MPQNTASLRIWSQVMTPAEISRELQAEPTRSHDRAAPRSLRIGSNSLYAESLWMLTSSAGSQRSMQAHVRQLIDFMEIRHDVLDRLKKVCQMDWICTYRQDRETGKLDLNSNSLRTLSRYNMSLVLDIYPPESADYNEDPRRWSFAQIRIESSTSTIADISNSLDLSPTHAYVREEPTTSNRTRKNRVIWLLDSGVDPRNNEWLSVENLLAIVSNRRDVLGALAETSQLSLCCSQASTTGQAGIIFEPLWVHQLSAVPIALAFRTFPARMLTLSGNITQL